MTRYNKEGMSGATEFLFKLIKKGHGRKIEIMGLKDKAAGTISNQLAWLINQKRIKRVRYGYYEVR